MKELYYMTQYANYMTDAGYYESMKEQLKELDRDQLAYLCKELAPKVCDQWNEILFEILYYVKQKDLNVLVEAWEYLADGEFKDFLDVLGVDYDGHGIYDYDEMEEMADDDFRTNGINAGARYWYKDLDTSYSYFTFNGYMNGLNCHDSFDKALLDEVDFYDIKNDILDYFK